MNLSRIAPLVGVAVLLLAGSQSAMAVYSLVDNFEGWSLGNANAGGSDAFPNGAPPGPWQPRDGNGDIGGSGLIQIQDDGSTQHLAFGWGSGQRAAYLPTITPITDGSSATYYFQIRSLDDTPDQSYGLSDVAVATNAAPIGFGDFEVQVALVDDGDGGNGQFKLAARPNSGLVDLVTGLVTNTWYDIWLVVDNTADTYDVFFGTTGDPNILGTKVANDLVFRNGVANNDLVSFMTLDGGGNPTDTQAHLDDIYHNPEAVPEPASLALLGIGGLLIARRRRA